MGLLALAFAWTHRAGEQLHDRAWLAWPACCPRRRGNRCCPRPSRTASRASCTIDVKYLPRMPDEAEHRYLLAAIDRASRRVYREIRPDKTAAAGFLERLRAKAPFVIRTALTDNSKEFTDRFCATGERPIRLRPDLRPPRH